MTRDTLKKYWDLKAEAEQLETEIQYLYETCIASPRLDGNFGNGNSVKPVSDVTFKFADKAAKLHTKLLMKRYEIMTVLEEIEDAIDGLEPLERRLMREYYINGRKWSEVCEKIGYAHAQTHRIHKAILEKMGF